MPARQFSARKPSSSPICSAKPCAVLPDEGYVLPDQALRRGRRTRRQPGRLGIIEIGDDEHGGGMFEQPVGHLLQRQPHVLVADFLGDDIERHGRKARMQRPHHPRQHRAVADAGVEDPQRRRRRLQIAEFERNPVGDLGLLAAGRDEQQVFLPVVEEPETGGLRCRARRQRRWPPSQPAAACFAQRRRGLMMFGQIGADLVQRAGGDFGAVAQARHQLAVIDDEPPEGGFGRLRRAAIVPDFAENLVGGFGSWRLDPGVPRSAWRSPAVFCLPAAIKGHRQVTSTTIGVGKNHGHVPTII